MSLFFSPSATAQNGETTPAPPASNGDAAAVEGITLGDVEAQRASAETNQNLDDTTRARIIELYSEAAQALTTADEWRQKSAEYDATIAESPARAEQLRAQAASPPVEGPVEIPETATLPDVEAMLAEADARYREAQANFESLVKEPGRRAERRRTIPALQDAANQRLQEARASLGETASAGEPPELQAARRARAQARIQAAREELNALTRELAAYEARGQLLDHLQVEARRNLGQAERRFKELQEITTQRRKEAAEQAAEDARLALEQMSSAEPKVRELATSIAARNQELAEQRTGPESIRDGIEDLQELIEHRSAEYNALDSDYDRIIERVSAGGLDNIVAQLLRQQRSELPDVRELRRNVNERRKRLAQVELGRSELREWRLQLTDLEVETADRIAAIPDITDFEKRQINDIFQQLLTAQRDLLDALQRDHDTFANQLLELNTRETQLADLAERFQAFIDENIFWVAGSNPLNLGILQSSLQAMRWLIAPDAWGEVPPYVLQDVEENIALYVLMLLLLLFLTVVRTRMRRQIHRLGDEAKKKRNTSILVTAEALLLTLLASLVVPFVVGLFGHRLSVAADAVPQAGAAGHGIYVASFVLFVLELLRLLFMRNGIGAAHFAWPVAELKQAKYVLTVMLLTVVPLSVVFFLFDYQEETAHNESLGRISFILAMLITAVALHRLSALSYRAMIDLRRTGWFIEKTTLRRLARLAISGLPVLLAGLAAAGFYYTSLQLSTRFFYSLCLILFAVLAIGMLRRWLLITRRKLAIEQARRRREAAKAEAEQENRDASMPSETDLLDAQLDIVKVDAQTQSLVRFTAVIAVLVGMWFIWSQVVPALNFLDRIELWHSTESVEERVPQEDGTEAVEVQERVVPVTLANLGLSALILLVMYAAYKNLPGLLEIVLTQKFQMASGERYATLAVVRYTLIALGLIFAFNAIGMGWGKLQWLVAALGVGLGFGLQEIFANFVSGLILLFERPMRVGDIVTVNNVSGVVSQIRIRATTIIDWDRKEMIIPNKSFVTGALVNWTLHDPNLRSIVQVGVAYGSDIPKALDILAQVAKDHPNVLSEPAPQVLFTGFGADSINLELRCFTSVPDAQMTKHDLYIAVERAMREAGVELPNPQRDLHLRSGDPLVVELKREQSDPPRVLET